jgi:polyphosphate kinase 2 (PPK2 family)
VRVHDEILHGQKLPRKLITKRIWDERYEDIAAFERYLARQGYLILKFFLHVSKRAQKDRFLERLDRSDKNWKFSLADARERGYWGRYMKAYEEMIRATAAPHAPWYVVPADRKWFTRLVVAAAINRGIDALRLSYPKVDEAKKRELREARAALDGAGEQKKGKEKKKKKDKDGDESGE